MCCRSISYWLPTVCTLNWALSLALLITQALSSQGAHIIHSLSSERHVNKLKAATAHWEAAPSVVYYDALQTGASDRLTEQVTSCADAVHGVVHAIAHAPSGVLSQPASECCAADFHSTMQVSAWSLLDVARAMLPLLDVASADGATDRSITTLSFAGSTRVRAPLGTLPRKRCNLASICAIVDAAVCRRIPGSTRLWYHGHCKGSPGGQRARVGC